MWESLLDGMQQFFAGVVILMVVGLVGLVFGQYCVPRKFIHYDRFPFRPYKWEDNGRFYLKLGINKWKDKMPDAGDYVKGVFYKKSMPKVRTSEFYRMFVIETCPAEIVHLLLMVISSSVYMIVHNGIGLFLWICYILGNVPFVMIQRYNRPRFVELYKRQKAIEDAQARKRIQSKPQGNVPVKETPRITKALPDMAEIK